MSGGRKIVVWGGIALVVLGGVLAAVLLLTTRQPITLKGAAIRADADPRKQLPVADVAIVAADGLASGETKSDASGFFRLPLRRGAKSGQPILLKFRHPDYQPLDLTEKVGDELYVAYLVPLHRSPPEPTARAVVVANVSLRYSEKTATVMNIGSAVKILQVENKGNVSCNGHAPCSPDGKWKAAVGSVSLDAGEGNEFRNARVSCVAGPCPFTRIDSDNFSRGGRKISVTVRDWSDTATYLLEAEVVHPTVSEVIRNSYPVIFGRTLNFSLPPEAGGPSIEAELNGATIVFPLGPNLCLSWANCMLRVEAGQSKIYRCELKPGFRF
jgi:hypothetical protein